MLISAVRLHILPKESMVLLTFGDSLEQPAEELFDSGFVFQPQRLLLLLLLGLCICACFDVGPCMQQQQSGVNGRVNCLNGLALRLSSCSLSRSHLGTCIYCL